ncbi:unnamed protein product, partial [Mesorhabditis belari]|uniref:Uncharacterized protein n=1 Tax=Mesorhabditis belari TaxID=2138241 RepID=A0AAF3ERW0_9BILA
MRLTPTSNDYSGLLCFCNTTNCNTGTPSVTTNMWHTGNVTMNKQVMPLAEPRFNSCYMDTDNDGILDRWAMAAGAPGVQMSEEFYRVIEGNAEYSPFYLGLITSYQYSTSLVSIYYTCNQTITRQGCFSQDYSKALGKVEIGIMQFTAFHVFCDEHLCNKDLETAQKSAMNHQSDWSEANSESGSRTTLVSTKTSTKYFPSATKCYYDPNAFRVITDDEKHRDGTSMCNKKPPSLTLSNDSLKISLGNVTFPSTRMPMVNCSSYRTNYIYNGKESELKFWSNISKIVTDTACALWADLENNCNNYTSLEKLSTNQTIKCYLGYWHVTAETDTCMGHFCFYVEYQETVGPNSDYGRGCVSQDYSKASGRIEVCCTGVSLFEN